MEKESSEQRRARVSQRIGEIVRDEKDLELEDCLSIFAVMMTGMCIKNSVSKDYFLENIKQTWDKVSSYVKKR